MSIGTLAKAGGVGVETIRFYQRKGLLPVPEQAEGVRRYGSAELQKLRFIRSAQSAGFTLEEIKELLVLDTHADRPRALELARHRLSQIDARIAELKAARAGLSRIANLCAGGSDGPCPILEAFES